MSTIKFESKTTHRQTTGRHDDSPTVFFTDSRLTDTTTDRHDKTQTQFKKKIKKKKNHRLTRRHSPTVTIPGK